ncbi:pectate lyase [Streptomyces sp. TS71-3]|uniref:pectate lyase n=1 Tax=Streptomyces sp. TS71-3 TaxID=2733862 RepID=UPI001AFCFC78|nr:pectate lyase [Streptomyces sp. TS71-3]GHJ39300.1 pectate lyase [Streptomyces sp. TS71-3]
MTPKRHHWRRARAVLVPVLAVPAALLAVPAAAGTGPHLQAAAAGWPTPTGQQNVSSTIQVSGTMDGRLVRYVGSGDLGDGGQDEGQDPLFDLANGATLQNVVIGSPAADGIHCEGTCTLKNVWWEDVGEDAATLKGKSSSQTMTIDGGGARKASDKVFQHNGPGTMVIRNFQVQDFGKLYRSCGNCGSQYARNVQVQNVTVTAPGKAIVGINTNYGDTARLSGITVVGDSSHKIVPCLKYKGVTSGEPSEIGSGPDSTNCLYKTSDISYQ